MTQLEFNALPLVLKPHHVKRILGLSDEGLRALREERPALVVSQPRALAKSKSGVVRRQGEYRYSKEEVAKLGKLRYE